MSPSCSAPWEIIITHLVARRGRSHHRAIPERQPRPRLLRPGRATTCLGTLQLSCTSLLTAPCAHSQANTYLTVDADAPLASALALPTPLPAAAQVTLASTRPLRASARSPLLTASAASTVSALAAEAPPLPLAATAGSTATGTLDGAGSSDGDTDSATERPLAPRPPALSAFPIGPGNRGGGSGTLTARERRALQVMPAVVAPRPQWDRVTVSGRAGATQLTRAPIDPRTEVLSGRSIAAPAPHPFPFSLRIPQSPYTLTS